MGGTTGSVWVICVDMGSNSHIRDALGDMKPGAMPCCLSLCGPCGCRVLGACRHLLLQPPGLSSRWLKLPGRGCDRGEPDCPASS